MKKSVYVSTLILTALTIAGCSAKKEGNKEETPTTVVEKTQEKQESNQNGDGDEVAEILQAAENNDLYEIDGVALPDTLPNSTYGEVQGNYRKGTSITLPYTFTLDGVKEIMQSDPVFGQLQLREETMENGLVQYHGEDAPSTHQYLRQGIRVLDPNDEYNQEFGLGFFYTCMDTHNYVNPYIFEVYFNDCSADYTTMKPVLTEILNKSVGPELANLLLESGAEENNHKYDYTYTFTIPTEDGNGSYEFTREIERDDDTYQYSFRVEYDDDNVEYSSSSEVIDYNKEANTINEEDKVAISDFFPHVTDTDKLHGFCQNIIGGTSAEGEETLTYLNKDNSEHRFTDDSNWDKVREFYIETCNECNYCVEIDLKLTEKAKNGATTYAGSYVENMGTYDLGNLYSDGEEVLAERARTYYMNQLIYRLQRLFPDADLSSITFDNMVDGIIDTSFDTVINDQPVTVYVNTQLFFDIYSITSGRLTVNFEYTK